MALESMLQEACKEFLPRYDDRQRRIIATYWETIAFTRKTGKVSANIMQTEMRYWQRFDADVVVAALAVHNEKYPTFRESYTRGIMRNMQADKDAGRPWQNKGGRQKQPPKENFKSEERDLNFLIE